MSEINSDILKAELEKIDNNFQEDELAYLALTRKIEPPIRNKLSFRLHQLLHPQNLLVSREWEHLDIVVLKNRKPRAIIEIKAMFTFDATDVKKDRKKWYQRISEKDG